MREASHQNKLTFTPYMSALGAWALAFGCSVGWGSFIMPGGTFLPIAGPIGSFIGIMLGGVVMLIIGANYHYLINRYPESGGTYAYTKRCFGYDHGLLCAWFLILTYIAIIWANASALPLVARTLLGSTFQFGFHYVIAGFHVYMGELILAILALVLAALVCLRRDLALKTQIVAAILLFAGVVVCFVIALGRSEAAQPFTPAFSSEQSALGGTLTIFALAPWAYVGFESISHSAAEAKYNLKHTFLIILIALAAAAAAYGLLVLLAVTALPEGCSSWVDYINNLGKYSGVTSQPTFHAAYTAMGNLGSVILGVAALCGIFTGLIGNYIALSRLIAALSDDGMIPGGIGNLDAHAVPRNAIFCILAISIIFPFLGRTAISWIVDVTTIGATIAYAFASASAWHSAKEEENKLFCIVGMAGMIVSFLFAIIFLVPNITSVKTLSTESYLILAAWGILGFIVFRLLLKQDKEKHLGRSTIAWIVLLGLIIFTSSVWMRQSTEAAVEKAVEPLQEYYMDALEEAGIDARSGATKPIASYVKESLQPINRTLFVSIFIQITLIVIALIFMFNIYSLTQKRERQTEIEKAIAEDASRAKTSFLSNMSHEIRTPMNAIIGLDNSALRNPDLQPQTREQLEKIGASAKHLLGLINDILDMSRIESGRMVLKNEEFSFREFLDQINIIINGQCQDKGLHYECHIIGKVSDFYYGDDMKLKQVFINILGNSVKFTEAPGDVTLTVEQTEESGGECTMRFQIKDTGIGMDAEYIPKIFDAFSQEDATTTNQYGGSGLGMAITKNFVEMMNGDIQVESQKGVGSTFTVTVKLRSSERAAHMQHDIALPEGLRVMVVDDDEIACEHAQIVLDAIGIKCDTCTDAEEALVRLREARERNNGYQLLLTDYKMPSMNGLQLTESLRGFDGGETAVIILTGYNWDIIEDDAKRSRVDSILSKPLFSDSLQRTIYTVLAKRAGEDVSAITQPADEETKRDLAGRRVLMAEDVAQNAEILQDLLELEEIETEQAVNGQVAVQMFSEKPAGYYDAILMDVRMPIMDGLTATRTIRAMDRPDAKTIPIIAMTANVFDEDVQRSMEAGMNAHLSKPIEPERLYDTIQKLICEKDHA